MVARFDGGTLTTDSGGLLLRETDRRLNLLPRLAECFLDARNPVFVDHSVEQFTLVQDRLFFENLLLISKDVPTLGRS